MQRNITTKDRARRANLCRELGKRSFINLQGKRFGKLVAIKPNGKTKANKILWLCKCDCGKETTKEGRNLRGGLTKSCGCLAKITAIVVHTKHGARSRIKGRPEYQIWASMKDRCGNWSSQSWKDYGGRGIKVCRRWRTSFVNFLSDMGAKPKGFSIHRKDNDGNYDPGNCVWASPKEQASNRRARVRA